MGDCPHQPVEVLVAHWPQIEVGHCCLHHSGVGLGPALSMGLKGQFSYNVLMEKAQDVISSRVIMRTPVLFDTMTVKREPEPQGVT